MQIKALTALSFFSLASAQSSPNIPGYTSAVGSYFASLQADPSFVNQIEGLATIDPNYLSSLLALATPQTDPAALTSPPALITQLPSPYNSLLMSVYQADVSIASANGLIQNGTPVTGAIAGATGAANSASGSVSGVVSQATSAASAKSSGATGISTAGAPAITGSAGVVVMGAVAGAIGAVAAIL